jgi:hypothetical protein
MVPLTGMAKLRVLSLGRNLIKKIEGLAVRGDGCRPLDARTLPPRTPLPCGCAWLQDVAGTLEQLWLSYNQIASLDGIQASRRTRHRHRHRGHTSRAVV